MEANNFIARLKADGSSKDVFDLDQINQEYKTVLTNLGAKDRGSFSLNVLCILCRYVRTVLLKKSYIFAMYKPCQ